MKPDDIALVVSLCRARAGLKVAPDKTYVIETQLAPVARREGFASIPDLLAAIRARREELLIWAVVEAMALGETWFFRDRAPFDQFRLDIAPLMARARPGASIKVWSAACGTGQEVYSLAMVAEEMMAADPKLHIELSASDLCTRALERAQSGLYNQFEVQRGLPIRMLAKHFEKVDEMWKVSPDLRQSVRWRRINLIAGLRAIGRFDVIFLRNVLCHMDPAAQKKVLEDLTWVLPDDGLLVLGQNESSAGVTEAYHPISARPGLYRRNPAFQVAA